MAPVVFNAAVTAPAVGEGGSATGIPATTADDSVDCTPPPAAITPREVVITPYTPTRADLVLGVRVRLAAPHQDQQACNSASSPLNYQLRPPVTSVKQDQQQAVRHTTTECKRQPYTMKVQTFTTQHCAAGSRMLGRSSANTVAPPSPQSGDDASMGQGKVDNGLRNGATGNHGPIHQAVEDDVVTLLPVLRGKGNFGRVYEGLWRGQAVAVKVLLLEQLAAFGMSLPGHTNCLPQQQTSNLRQDSTWWRNGSWLHRAEEEEDDEQEEVEDKEEQLRAGEVPEGMKELGVPGPSSCGGHMAHGSAASVDLAAGDDEALLSSAPDPPQPQANMTVTDIPNPITDHHHMLTSLEQEVQVLGRCFHPNVVQLLAACLTPPRVCLVMELMDTSLDTLLYGQKGSHESRLVSSDDRDESNIGGPSKLQQLLPLPKVLHIAAQIAAALEYLHPTIVHRDLKGGTSPVATNLAVPTFPGVSGHPHPVSHADFSEISGFPRFSTHHQHPAESAESTKASTPLLVSSQVTLIGVVTVHRHGGTLPLTLGSLARSQSG
ncbi:hypothetical protein VaNZ11_002324 [Volvox africanus]|uniref:Protein kinase domain-containing protein n=1 Tax=Volvox africanus TaxID=51714 RepID=A0ABQ5RRP1_9CHLO|nr:hypothetical protein VaNZ11_002324 [Volvox africanus]